MKYLGKIQDDKDLVTKEYVDNSIPDSTSDLTNDSGFISSFPIEWKTSNSYPTGWRAGYVAGNVGDSNWSTESAERYLRPYYAINTTNYPKFADVKSMEIIPPAGYGVKIFEKDDNGITRIVSFANTQSRPEYGGKPVRINVNSSYSYALFIGNTITATAAEKASDSEFIATISGMFYTDRLGDLIDTQLQLDGHAADAKATGEAIASLSSVYLRSWVADSEEET